MNEKPKTVIFAGLGRLGAAAVDELLSTGHSAVISFRPGRSSQQTAEDLVNRHGSDKCMTVSADLEDPNQAAALITKCLDRFGKCDALINVASGYPDEENDWQRWQNGGPVTESDWQFYESNFTVALNTINPLLQWLQTLPAQPPAPVSIINFTDARSLLYLDSETLDPYEKTGGILKITSRTDRQSALKKIARTAPSRHANPYTLAKLDLVYLTRRLALEYGPNVRANAIAPGPMLPPPGKTESDVKGVIEKTALKKWGTAKPITQTVRFLVENDFITGQTVKVDGGMNLWARYSR